jgi:flagellar hook-basal body complex protein FliE
LGRGKKRKMKGIQSNSFYINISQCGGPQPKFELSFFDVKEKKTKTENKVDNIVEGKSPVFHDGHERKEKKQQFIQTRKEIKNKILCTASNWVNW